MSAQVPVATAVARIGGTTALRVDAGGHAVVVDDAGPTPLQLMTGALASCSALSAQTYLASHGDAASSGEIQVTITLDAGPPTLLHRRVALTGWPSGEAIHGMAAALERTEVTRLLRPSYQIRTVIEQADHERT